jgi:hypothetical protein
MAIFWLFMDMLPGANFRFNSLGRLIAALGFTFAISFGNFIIYFLKLPRLWFAYLISRLIMVLAYLWLLDTFLPAILDLGPSFLGNFDFILFKLPKLIELPNVYFTIAFSAPFLVICSIILEKLKK